MSGSSKVKPEERLEKSSIPAAESPPQTARKAVEATRLLDGLVGYTQIGCFGEIRSALNKVPYEIANLTVNTPLRKAWYVGGPLQDTLLHVACKCFEFDVALLLVRFGANINARNSDGQTPLDFLDPISAKRIQQASSITPEALDNILDKEEVARAYYLVHHKRPRVINTLFPAHEPCTNTRDLQGQIVHDFDLNPSSLSSREALFARIPEFGLPLFETCPGEKRKMRSRLHEVPAVLDRILSIIEYHVSTNRDVVVPELNRVLSFFTSRVLMKESWTKPSTQDIRHTSRRPFVLLPFSVSTDKEISDAVNLLLDDLNQDVEAGNKERFKHTIEEMSVIKPSVLMELVLTYFVSLPCSVVPVKFTPTFTHLSTVPCTEAALSQMRFLYQYLPSISRLFLIRFSTFFRKVFCPRENNANRITLSRAFIAFFFPILENPACATEMIDPHVLGELLFRQEVFFSLGIIENIDYLSLLVDTPDMSGFVYCALRPRVQDYILRATALVDCPSSLSGDDGEGNLLPLAAGDEVIVMGFKDGWVEAMAHNRRGFVSPSSIRLLLFSTIPLSGKDDSAFDPRILDDDVEDQENGSAKTGVTKLLPKKLPEDWIQAIDPRTGKIYYINRVLHISQWSRPVDSLFSPDHTEAQIDCDSVPPRPVSAPLKEHNRGLPSEPVNIVYDSPLSTKDTLTKKLEYIRRAEEELMQERLRLHAEEEKIRSIQQQLEVRSHLETMKPVSTMTWQISYNELVFQKKIGEGGYGDVFLASWCGTPVAVKVLKNQQSGVKDTEENNGSYSSHEVVSRFTKEVNFLRSMHHPSIILFMGACTCPYLCIVTEYMSGGTLYEALHRKKRVFSPNRIAVLATDIAQAIAYLHRMKPPIIHRDLKSLNILLDDHGVHAKVGDIGLARVRDISGANLTGFAGTFSWMAPEMLSGQAYTEKVDVYSFGVVLAEMWTGSVPFPNLSLEDVRTRVCSNDERPSLPDSLSSDWVKLIKSCWGHAAETRPSFVEIISSLQAIKSSLSSCREPSKSQTDETEESEHIPDVPAPVAPTKPAKKHKAKQDAEKVSH